MRWMAQLVRTYPSLLQVFFEDSKVIYQSLTEVTTTLSIKAFNFALYNLNVIIKLCKTSDVQYDQVSTAIEDLHSSVRMLSSPPALHIRPGPTL